MGASSSDEANWVPFEPHKHPKSKTVNKVAVLGATGQSGKECVKELLIKHYNVVAIVRNKEKATNFWDESEHLEIVEMSSEDQLKAEKLAEVFEHVDAVFISLAFKDKTQHMPSTKAIYEAMHKTGTTRLVQMTSQGTAPEERHHKSWSMFEQYVVFGMILKTELDELFKVEQWIEGEAKEKYPEIQTTIIKTALIKDAVVKKKPVKVAVGDGFIVKGPHHIYTNDIARFMVGAIGCEEYYGKKVGICTGAD